MLLRSKYEMKTIRGLGKGEWGKGDEMGGDERGDEREEVVQDRRVAQDDDFLDTGTCLIDFSAL